MPMPTYFGRFRWAYLSCSEYLYSSYDHGHLIRLRLPLVRCHGLGAVLCYEQETGKYPPDDMPRWQPLRDLLRFLWNRKAVRERRR